MSILQLDRAALETRKRASDVEPAKLIDQSLGELRKKLEDENYPAKIKQILAAGDSQRQLWMERQKDYLEDWDEFLEASADGPFEGASNLRLPITFIVCKALHARYMQAILGMHPYAQVEARKEAYTDQAPAVQDTLQYYLECGGNYGVGMHRTIDQWLWKWITEGSGFLAQRWECEYEEYMDVITEYPPSVETIDGKEVVVPKPTEMEKKVNKKVFEGPVWEVVFPEDLIIIGGNGDINSADSVHRIRWATASELQTYADRKIFDQESVDRIIEGGADWRAGVMLQNDIKFQRAYNAGQTRLWTEADLDRYELVESYVKMDVHGNGINSKLVTWTHRRSNTTPGATYLRRINKNGLLPIQKIDYHIRPGQVYGAGVPELMHPLSVEITAMHNQRIDNGTISNMPFWFYRSTSSINPVEIQLRPGTGIPLDNPQTDVNFPNIGNKTAFGAQEEQNLNTWIERMFGISDLSLGAMSGSQGATRTASGVQALQGESNINLNVPLQRLNEGWTQALNYLLTTLQKRIPEGLSFKVTGDEGSDYWRTIRSSDDIAGEYDIKVSGNTADSNKSVQQSTADVVLQMASNPLYVQMGIVQPINTYEALKNTLKVRGIKNFAQYITQPQGQHPTLTPGDEVNRIIAGQEVPVDLRSDHQGFITLFEHIRSSDELLGALNREQVLALAAQAQKHGQAIQALQAQAAQSANTQQMQQNQQMRMRGNAVPTPSAPPQSGPPQQ